MRPANSGSGGRASGSRCIPTARSWWNSTTGTATSSEDGLPVTTKKDKEYHGFGVKSIRQSVEQHNGVTTISTDSGWFRLKLLIPLSEESKTN